MKPDDIYSLIEGCNTPYLRIFDFNNRKLWVCEDVRTAPEAIAKLKSVLPMYAPYKRVIVHGATEKQFQLKYQACFQWNCDFPDTASVGAFQTSGNPWEWKMPAGMMPESTMTAQIALIAANNAAAIKELEYKWKLKELEGKDPLDKIEKFAPLLLLAMGKTTDEIKNIAIASANWNATLANPAAGGIAGPQTHTLKMMDVETLSKMDPTARATKCQEALNELGKHLSQEHMIILCERLAAKLDKAKGGDPTFINTVLLYI
jgi:hypothetical protein